jgi:hypothetical protein
MADIVNRRQSYSVSIPEKTPSGQLVTVESWEDDGLQVLHAESPDQSELYFEVAAYPELRAHDALAAPPTTPGPPSASRARFRGSGRCGDSCSSTAASAPTGSSSTRRPP